MCVATISGFWADALCCRWMFTLPFVVIMSDLLLIVSKINTTWLFPWEQDACSSRLGEPALHTRNNLLFPLLKEAHKMIDESPVTVIPS